jgi:hypothetical protein
VTAAAQIGMGVVSRLLLSAAPVKASIVPIGDVAELIDDACCTILSWQSQWQHAEPRRCLALDIKVNL